MILYFSIFLVVSYFAYLEVLDIAKGVTLRLLYICSFFLFALSFMRWERGTDWDTYYLLWETLEWDNMIIMEPIFSSVNILTREFFDNYTVHLFVLSSILFGFQTISIKRYSLYPLLSLMMLVGSQLGNVFYVRQNIAIAIALFSFIYIIKGKFANYLLCVFLAIGFHYSAIVFLPSWWICKLEIGPRKWLVLIILSVFSSFLMMAILKIVGDLLGGGILYRIIYYTENDIEANPNISYPIQVAKAILNKGAFLIIAFYLLNKKTENALTNKFVNLYCFGVILFFLTMPISIHFARASWYYDIFQIFIIPLFMSSIKERKNRQIVFLVMFPIYLVKLYVFIMGYKDLYVPYNLAPIF